MTTTSDFYQLNENFELGDIDNTSPLYVELGDARAKTLRHIYLALGLEKDERGKLVPCPSPAKKQKHWLLFGHRGCGKSTELNNLQQSLADSNYRVVRLRTEQELNPHNLAFSDIFILLLEKLATEFPQHESYIRPLLDALQSERIITQEVKNDLKIGAGASVSLFATLKAQFTYNSKLVDTLRTKIRQNYQELVGQLNQLIAVIEATEDKKLLLIIDGTDKIGIEDAKGLFTDSANLITQIDCYCFYTAPIHLRLEEGQTGQIYQTFTLPMIKLYENHKQAQAATQKCDTHYQKLRNFIEKRVPIQFFADAGVMDACITASGGHPRHLTALLERAWTEARLEGQDIITTELVNTAEKYLMIEYFAWLEQKHWDAINQVLQDGSYFDDAVRELSLNLAVLEYNGNESWRFPHPLLKHHPKYPQ